jgi:outer membrane immunogenic protein
MFQLKTMAACALLGLMGAAHADDSGFYLGAGVGEATQNNAVFHGSDTSFRLLAGYSLNKYLAAEAGYADGGTQSDTFGAVKVDASGKGTFGAVLGKLPLGTRFAPYAKFGYVYYDATTTISDGVNRTSRKAHADKILFGGGLEMRLGEHARLRADYEKVRVPDVAYDVYTIIATWQF